VIAHVVLDLDQQFSTLDEAQRSLQSVRLLPAKDDALD
jgi:hypothetical protein